MYNLQDVKILKKQFRRSPHSASELLSDVLAKSKISIECEEFLKFQALFEKAIGLNEARLKTTLAIRIALTTLWSDKNVRYILSVFFTSLSTGELLYFASIHGIISDDVMETAKNLTDWFLMNSIEAVPNSFSTIEVLSGRQTAQKMPGSPLLLMLKEFLATRHSLSLSSSSSLSPGVLQSNQVELTIKSRPPRPSRL